MAHWYRKKVKYRVFPLRYIRKGAPVYREFIGRSVKRKKLVRKRRKRFWTHRRWLRRGRALVYGYGAIIFPYAQYKWRKRSKSYSKRSLIKKITEDEAVYKRLEKGEYPVAIYRVLMRFFFRFFLKKKRKKNLRRVLSEPSKRHVAKYRVQIQSSNRVLQIRSYLRSKVDVFWLWNLLLRFNFKYNFLEIVCYFVFWNDGRCII